MRRLRAGWVAGTLVVPLVFCVTVPGSSAGNPPSSAAAPAPTWESIVVTLSDGTGLGRVSAPSRREDAGDVKKRLRAHATSSQRALLARIAGWRRQGLVADVRSLWISNSVALTAPPDVVARIAARADVALVS